MEISPIQIFYMTLVSLALGATAGIINDVNRAVRIFLGVRYGARRFEKLYSIKLPLLKRCIKEPSESKASKVLLPVIMFFQDVLLFAFSGVGVAILNYYFNSGRARIYTPLAVVAGFVIYYFTVGRAVLYFSEAAVFFIKAAFLIIFELFYYPARRIVNFFGIFAKKICTNLYKTIAKKQKMVYNNNKINFVKRSAARGFADVTKK
ncbi:MAG: spore cortex biosynthesis protein YabQ [Clostridia bacterium]|nr:spore cortex biosynthesis protein YabQ [Clostridia bacterium]